MKYQDIINLSYDDFEKQNGKIWKAIKKLNNKELIKLLNQVNTLWPKDQDDSPYDGIYCSILEILQERAGKLVTKFIRGINKEETIMIELIGDTNLEDYF